MLLPMAFARMRCSYVALRGSLISSYCTKFIDLLVKNPMSRKKISAPGTPVPDQFD